MTKENVEQKAFDYYSSGFNCAEAVLKTFVDLYSQEPDIETTKFASGFGGGMGGSTYETCGALTGGIIVIGWLFGRTKPVDDKTKVMSISAEFRKLFLERFGVTQCKALKNLENKTDCKELTAKTAGILYEILKKI